MHPWIFYFLQGFAPSALEQRLSMSTYLLAAVQNRHLHLCLWHIMFLGGMLVCLIEVVPLIWLFLVDQKNCPIFYFPLFVSSSQAWRHTFSFWYDYLDQTNHTFSESQSLWLTVAKKENPVQLSTVQYSPVQPCTTRHPCKHRFTRNPIFPFRHRLVYFVLFFNVLEEQRNRHSLGYNCAKTTPVVPSRVRYKKNKLNCSFPQLFNHMFLLMSRKYVSVVNESMFLANEKLSLMVAWS